MSLSFEARLSMGLLVAWAIVLPSAVLGIRTAYQTAGQESQNTRAIIRFMPHVTKFHFQAFGADGLGVSVIADSLSITPRRILFFNLKSINEARLENAHVEIHLHNAAVADVDLATNAMSIFAPADPQAANRAPPPFGLITRTVARGIEIDIFDDATPSISLRAERMYTEKDRRKVRFVGNARLKDIGSGREIAGNEIVWDAESNAFLIPGAYVARRESRVATGRGARVDLHFVVTPLAR